MAAEIDKYVNQAYKAIYGHDTNGDVTKIQTDDIPEHELLTAGFPCQSFSIAGNRRGFADKRGTLFFEIERIIEAKKPKYILLENVKGLLSHDKGKTLEIILKTLSHIGYTIDYTILNSKFYGVPQNRERLFIVGVLDGSQEPYIIHGSNVLAKSKQKINTLGIRTFNFPFPLLEEVTTQLRDFLESEPDEKYYLTEDKTKKLIEQLKKTKIQTIPSTINVIGRLEINGNDICKRVYDTCGISPTLPTGSSGNTTPKVLTQEVRPVITPDRGNKRQNGRRFKEDGDVSFTLTAMDRHGIALGRYPKYKIRKLTPLEALRLQGFPDEYYHKLKQEKISDTQLYKMAGNAVTVNVVEAIISNLK